MVERPSDPGASSPSDARQDELFRALANGRRRLVLRQLATTDGDVASVDDLVDEIVARADLPVDRERVAVALHHGALPHLDEAGLVEYDARSRTVRYRETPQVERALHLVGDAEVVA